MDNYSDGFLDQHYYHHHHTTAADIMPDMEGWLNKQGGKYKTWNRRWFVLKGPNLFYFKSPKDVRMKGIINLRGYRVLCDERIYTGKWCFKAHHERERTFYFYTNVEQAMKAWMKALMKATIGRDYGAPVLSSSTIPTVSLDIARRMKPRPPSMILYKREQCRSLSSMMESNESPGYDNSTMSDDGPADPESEEVEEDNDDQSEMTMDEEFYLTEDDEGHEDYSSLTWTIESQQELQDSGFDGTQDIPLATADKGVPVAKSKPDVTEGGQQQPDADSGVTDTSFVSAEEEDWNTIDYLDWIQGHISSSSRSYYRVSSLDELRSGEIIIKLLENVSGKTVRRPTKPSHGSTSMEMLDTIMAAFKFMSREGIDIEGRITIKDLFGGNEPKIKEMLDAVRVWADMRS